MKTLLLLIISFIVVPPSVSSADETFDHDHKTWNELLQENVKLNGSVSTVNYKNIKAKPEKLNSYLQKIGSVKEADFTKWEKNKKMVFLINAYNAFTVKLIIDNYPVKSIKDLGGLFSSPWKKKFFTLFDESRSLDWIEHEKIRPVFNEPRIHFALVCASKGCPALQNEAFRSDKLDQQLFSAARKFLTDKSRNEFKLDKGILNISSIFKWYKDDFVKTYGSVEAFIIPYIVEDNLDIMKRLNSHYEINYMDYDWTLNE